MSIISNLASISPKAQIGKNVTIEPFSVIGEDVVIGDNTWIASNVNIFAGSRIGKNCKIFPTAVIGAVPQDLKFHGEYSTVIIGDNTTIREAVTINRGTEDRQTTKIGDNCLIMAYVHVAHDCLIGNHCILSNATQLAGHVTLDDYSIMGGVSGSLQKLRIGKHAFVSGGTLLGKDVPPYMKVMYTPGNYAGVNTLGLLRRGFTRETIEQIVEIYKIIYNSDLNTSQAIKHIQENIPPSIEKDEIVSFIQQSVKGIIPKTSKNRNEGNYTSESN